MLGVDPQFCPSTLTFYPMGVTLTYRSQSSPMSQFPSLKWACMWSIECVCSSLQSVIMVIFLLASCHRKQVVPPRGFSSIGVYWSMPNSEHLSLFQSYLSYPNSKSCDVYFVGFLIFQGGFFLKIHKFCQSFNQSI